MNTCPTCGGPALVWADNSDGITVNFACDNAACSAGKGPWDTPRPVDAGHLGACLLSALFGEPECPATVDGKHFYEQQEDVTGRIVWGCDCGALPPERDPDDF